MDQVWFKLGPAVEYGLCSWGPMFDFASLWGRDLVGNWFVQLQSITLLNVRGDVSL